MKEEGRNEDDSKNSGQLQQKQQKWESKGKSLYLYSESGINKHLKRCILMIQMTIAIKMHLGGRASMTDVLIVTPHNSKGINRRTLGNKALYTVRFSNCHK